LRFSGVKIAPFSYIQICTRIATAQNQKNVLKDFSLPQHLNNWMKHVNMAAPTNLPRIEGEDGRQRTLYGHGDKPRTVPLPALAIAPLVAYRLARSLPTEPSAHEVLPLIHGFKGGALQEGGTVCRGEGNLRGSRRRPASQQSGTPVLLRVASPHWLRHAYAEALGSTI
jgi:hypothetical protein